MKLTLLLVSLVTAQSIGVSSTSAKPAPTNTPNGNQTVTTAEVITRECLKALEDAGDQRVCASLMDSSLEVLNILGTMNQFRKELPAICSEKCSKFVEDWKSALKSPACKSSTLTDKKTPVADSANIQSFVRDVLCLKDGDQFCIVKQYDELQPAISQAANSTQVQQIVKDPKYVCTDCTKRQMAANEKLLKEIPGSLKSEAAEKIGSIQSEYKAICEKEPTRADGKSGAQNTQTAIGLLSLALFYYILI